MTGTNTIATLGSHSSLQIMKGAKDEGFSTLLVTKSDRAWFYRQFAFIDEVIEVPSFDTFDEVETQLIEKNAILIPHGSFVAYLGMEKNKKMQVPYYGNKTVLDWESNRERQWQWFEKAGIRTPRHFSSAEEIDRPVIVKLHGAAGGRGYFYANNRVEFERKITEYNFKVNEYIIQEYIVGVPVYVHYFYSPIDNRIEIMSVDRRYETNVDSLGRIPPQDQLSLYIEPSYVVIGNSPLVLRESMLPEAQRMGEKMVSASKELMDERGLYGPFCMETIVTEEQQFYTIEVSCRIVAGTNLYTEGSPYSWLYFNEPMSTGRRIAREIKTAIRDDRLNEII
ncbi:MAG: formate--phosphoribosylaminoimidazolecarboxamide ligase [Patescibacteria group bacterium]